MNCKRQIVVCFSALMLCNAAGLCDDVAKLVVPSPGATFNGTDSLACDTDTTADTQECLTGLRWKPSDFIVRCEAAESDRGDVLIRFNSPISTDNAINDNVSMEWYVARDADRKPMRAHPMIIVHESDCWLFVRRSFIPCVNHPFLPLR